MVYSASLRTTPGTMVMSQTRRSPQREMERNAGLTSRHSCATLRLVANDPRHDGDGPNRRSPQRLIWRYSAGLTSCQPCAILSLVVSPSSHRPAVDATNRSRRSLSAKRAGRVARDVARCPPLQLRADPWFFVRLRPVYGKLYLHN